MMTAKPPIPTPEAHIEQVRRWFELSRQIRDSGDELGEERFEKFLQTLDLSLEDVKEIIDMLKLHAQMVQHHSDYCVRKLKTNQPARI